MLRPFAVYLVILTAHLEEALGVTAYRAHLGSLLAHDQMAAHTALPHGQLALLEYLLHLNVLQQTAVALLMALLDGSHLAELLGQLREAFLFGIFGKAVVHVGPLVVFALGCGQQVVGGGTQATQGLEPQAGMLLLVAGSLAEHLGQLLITLALGYLSKVGVLAAGLALAGKGFAQVLLGLGAGITAAALRLLDLLKYRSGLAAAGAGEILGQRAS